MTEQTADMVEQAVVDSGARSVNINSTTGGKHYAASRHYLGKAVDINRINGSPVTDLKNKGHVKALQDAFQLQANIRENFGPAYQRKTIGGKVVNRPDMAGMHATHIHVSGQK